jgi:quercetin dioxygenase-like cupin family protein
MKLTASELHRFAFKVLTRDTNGELFIIEHTTRQKGGPPHHIHPHQDEWFYVIEGVPLEVGHHRVTLRPGGSILAPRNLPHAWAFVGNNGGRMLISYATPPGTMEAFSREVTESNSMPRQDKALFERFDLILISPPLSV